MSPRKQYFIIRGLDLLKMRLNTKFSFMELDLYFFFSKPSDKANMLYAISITCKLHLQLFPLLALELEDTVALVLSAPVGAPLMVRVKF